METGPSRRSSKIFQREVFDSLNIFKAYKSKWILDSSSEQEKLKEILKAYKFTGTTQQLCLSMLNNWLQLSDPLAFEEYAVSHLLDEFVDAVSKNRIMTKSRFAIEGLTIANIPTLLEENILIRQVPIKWHLGIIEVTHAQRPVLVQVVQGSDKAVHLSILKLPSKGCIGMAEVTNRMIRDFE